MAGYDVNYDDPRFKSVEAEKTAALSETEKTYAGMINNSDKFYQQQIDASKQWADKQSQIQQEQSDFAIEQIEQQKDQAHKDYIKEQSGAYVDWRKQSNEYGAEAEQMASAGLTNTGFSESSQVSMYNTYQNRVATARDSFNRAVLNYDNAIKDARLQNNAALAEIAYNALQQQLQLSLEGFQYKNNLIIAKADKKMEVNNQYYQRYRDVLAQINTENALEEEIRQYNESLAEQKRQHNEQMAFQREQWEYQKKKSKKSSGGGGGGGGGIVAGGTGATVKSVNGPYRTDNNSKDSNTEKQNYNDAYKYLSSMITRGASKAQVLAEIAIAQKNGALSQRAATKLKQTFNPKGQQYT